MTNKSNFWQLWAPHLALFEDNHLDLRTINIIADKISQPVLIVGGGQGLIIDALRKKGLHVDGVDSNSEMVRLAEQRRGIKLVHTDGSSLPFADESYATTIISTGVVDFLDDEKQILQIINEARRVTKKGGSLLVSYYKVHPVAEKFFNRIGIITENHIMRLRRLFELSRLPPSKFIADIRQDGNLSLCGAIAELLRIQWFLPKKERLLSNTMSKILKTADNADELIGSAPEAIPHHTRESISTLCKKLKLSVNTLVDYEMCFVVDVGVESKPL
ncbi:methyltransferase family protein [Methylobacter tundripaludum]|uniref:Methyltransferase family protein n=1 Tax=Methylobacter tundripaludum TaxID=173365 RepID=A0A2S6H3U7_9GAMM|nr:class I SAM-dependent methyltransferase [Methylobacter tundripaludum]PPK72172.1 methyltransferase family protein [Methylobacter tundripaludum]